VSHATLRKLLLAKRLDDVKTYGAGGRPTCQDAEARAFLAQLRKLAATAPPSREDPALDSDVGGRCTTEHAESADWVVSRQDDDLDPGCSALVEGEELLDEVERHPATGGLVQSFQLEAHIC
jgi:hypothetical protein